MQDSHPSLIVLKHCIVCTFLITKKVHGGQFLEEPRQNGSYMEKFFMKIIKEQT